MKYVKKLIDKVEFKKDVAPEPDRGPINAGMDTPGSSVNLGTIMSLNHMRRVNQI